MYMYTHIHITQFANKVPLLQLQDLSNQNISSGRHLVIFPVLKTLPE